MKKVNKYKIDTQRKYICLKKTEYAQNMHVGDIVRNKRVGKGSTRICLADAPNEIVGFDINIRPKVWRGLCGLMGLYPLDLLTKEEVLLILLGDQHVISEYEGKKNWA
jgi:hypothetical protein